MLLGLHNTLGTNLPSCDIYQMLILFFRLILITFLLKLRFLNVQLNLIFRYRLERSLTQIRGQSRNIMLNRHHIDFIALEIC